MPGPPLVPLYDHHASWQSLLCPHYMPAKPPDISPVQLPSQHVPIRIYAAK
jgi:hypothetical protein